MTDLLSAAVLKVVIAVAPAVVNTGLNPPISQPNVAGLQESLGDAAEGILKCYHHTGEFRSVQALESLWTGAATFNANRSVLLKIDWQGRYLLAKYTTVVALMERNHAVKTYVVSDTAIVPKNANCALQNWTPVER